MPTVNTGLRRFNKLVKVTNDNTNRPLDENNRLISVTGLDQDSKDNNVNDPDYIPPVINLTACPTPGIAIVSEWGEWGECINGTQTRTRTVITPATNGGTTPVLIETRTCIPTFPFKWIGDDPECITITT